MIRPFLSQGSFSILCSAKKSLYISTYWKIFVHADEPVIDMAMLVSFKEDVQGLLKTFQLSTRQLHHMCGHSKVIWLFLLNWRKDRVCVVFTFILGISLTDYNTLVLRCIRIPAWPTTCQPWRRASSCLYTEWRPCWRSTTVRRPFGWVIWRIATWR